MTGSSSGTWLAPINLVDLDLATFDQLAADRRGDEATFLMWLSGLPRCVVGKFRGNVLCGQIIGPDYQQDTHVAIVRRGHACEGWSTYQASSEPWTIGIIDTTGITWYSPSETPIQDSPFAQWLFALARQHRPAHIGIALEFTELIAYLVSHHDTKTGVYYVGPVVFFTVGGIDADTVILTMPDQSEQTVYFAEGFDELELATYVSFRQHGLSIEQARTSTQLISATPQAGQLAGARDA